MKRTARRTFEVLVSHDGLNIGERFTQPADDLGWALQRVQAGYLRDVTEGDADAGGSEASQG